GSLAELFYFCVGVGFAPVPTRLEGWKNDNGRSRSRPVHPFQGDDRCPERDQPSSKRRESGFELFVMGLKSCWVMNLDQGDKKGRHCDCGFEWGRLIGHGCDSGLDLSPAAAGRSALKRLYRTDAMISHLRHICGPRSAPKTYGPASVAVPHVRHLYPTEFYAAACRKAAIARS